VWLWSCPPGCSQAARGHRQRCPLEIALLLVKVTVAVSPVELLLKLLSVQVSPAVPAIGPSERGDGRVPEQVAVPLARVAVVGGTVAPEPADWMKTGVGLAMVLSADSSTEAVTPLAPLKPLSRQGLPLRSGDRAAGI